VPLDHAEFENRLRDLGALGPCVACGFEEADKLDPTPVELPTPDPQAVVGVYIAVCPRCGKPFGFLRAGRDSKPENEPTRGLM